MHPFEGELGVSTAQQLTLGALTLRTCQNSHAPLFTHRASEGLMNFGDVQTRTIIHSP